MKQAHFVFPEGAAVAGPAVASTGITDEPPHDLDSTFRRGPESVRGFLEEATRVLASSLDYDKTLANVAHLAVPRLADWCALDMAEDGGPIRRLAVAHVNTSKAEIARSLRFYPSSTRPNSLVSRVLREGNPVLFERVSEEDLITTARNASHLAILRTMDLKSIMVVPIRAENRTLGAITFASSESARAFSRAELEMAQNLAYRAGVAVENARLYREARDANRAKDQFLATVSHELRTPLNAVLGWAQLLRAGVLGTKAAERALEAIERNAKAQTRIVEDLLDVSRVIAGKLRLQPSSVNLAGLIEATLESARLAVNAKGIDLEVRLPRGDSEVFGDPDRLQQVIWNLVTNAIKFTPRGGRILACLEAGESDVIFSISDSGIGIPPEFMPFLFERFRQADGSTSRSHGGLGLGLSIVRHLVELHGGTVIAESDGPDLGATFTVRLPRHAADRMCAQ